MRHYFPASTFAALASVAALALGMTVPAASRLLISTPRRAHRFASGEAAAVRSAVLLSTVANRADEHLAPAPDVDGQVWIVRGYVGLFAESDLTPTPGWRHLTGGADPPLIGNIGSNARKGQINSPGRQDDSANSARARWLFGDHVNTDVHRLCALFRSHEHPAA